MDLLPFKFVLTATNFGVLFLLVMILIKHSSYKFDIRSWSTGFNLLCVVWLSFRGAFWILTMCSINYWIGSTFYILFWVPMPISFGAFMLIPLFFAHLLYRTEWKYYWDKIWWIYTATTIGLAIFMISWSILSAMSIQRDLECINGTAAGQPARPPTACYDTAYSTIAFRGVTAVCFLFLAANCAAFGKKILTLGGFGGSIYVGHSMEELYRVNLFLFASFLSRGLYECLDVMEIFRLPSIPLQGDEDVSFETFFVFMFWDYFPTLLWIVVVTGRDVVGSLNWRESDRERDAYTPIGSNVAAGISSDHLSELGRYASAGGSELKPDQDELPFFYNADGMQMVVGTPAKRSWGESTPIQPRAKISVDGADLLGRRFALPSSLAPVNSWLSPSNEEGASMFRGRSASGSGTSRSLIYGTFGDDVFSASNGSTGAGNPLSLYSSTSVASSPKMPWPEALRSAEAAEQVPILSVPPPVSNYKPAPPSAIIDKRSESPSYTSEYYDNDSTAAPLSGVPRKSPLIRGATSPSRLSVNTGAPPMLYTSPSYLPPSTSNPEAIPSCLLEPEINGQDYLNDIAASYSKGWDGTGMPAPPVAFPGPPSVRGIRSRSNTVEGSQPLPPVSPALPPAGQGSQLNVPGIWRHMPPTAVPNKTLRVATVNNIMNQRLGGLPGSNTPGISPPDSPVICGLKASDDTCYVSSPGSSNPSCSNGGTRGNSPQLSLPPPPPPPHTSGGWQKHYFTDDPNRYSGDSSSNIEQGSPPVAAT